MTQARDFGPCRSCRAPMRWVYTEHGRKMPLDVEPDLERGNVVLNERKHAITFRSAELARMYVNGHPECEGPFASHFATCPHREQHRRRRRRPGLRAAVRHELDRQAQELRRRYRLRRDTTSHQWRWASDDARMAERSIREVLADSDRGVRIPERRVAGVLGRAQELLAQEVLL